MAAARQNDMKESITDVATTTFTRLLVLDALILIFELRATE
jgi:hypothetical protein